jgi:hypothetical protein
MTREGGCLHSERTSDAVIGGEDGSLDVDPKAHTDILFIRGAAA